MSLQIEEHDLGDNVEGYYTEDPVPALMAIGRGLSYQIQQARAIEGHGYYARPPRSGRRVCLAKKFYDWIDEVSVESIRRVVQDHIPTGEIEQVKTSYLASEYGDAFWIGFDLRLHPYIVIAVLRNLEAEGRLPIHPSLEG